MKITEAEGLSNRFLSSLGFVEWDALLITKNLIEAELAEKKTHGLVRLLKIKQEVENKRINLGGVN